MYLILAMFIATIFGGILFLLGKLGIIVAFGIIVGIFVRALYLLENINKNINNQKANLMEDPNEEF